MAEWGRWSFRWNLRFQLGRIEWVGGWSRPSGWPYGGLPLPTHLGNNPSVYKSLRPGQSSIWTGPTKGLMAHGWGFLSLINILADNLESGKMLQCDAEHLIGVRVGDRMLVLCI